jgi:putative oxidoreductase
VTNRALAILLARLVLGLIFFMAGWWKVFSLGPLAHARNLFVEPYAETFLPAWSLWASGTVVPFVELSAGALVLLGLFRRPAYFALAGVLVLVTYGHLLAEPLFQFHTHVIPRTALLLFLLVMPAGEDRASIDEWLRGRRGRIEPTGTG